MKFIEKALKTLILLLVIICSSCDSEESLSSDWIDTVVRLTVTNSQSESVFDSTINEAFDKDKIKIFYLENGEYKEYYFGNHGGYDGYSFEDESNVMNLYPYILDLGNIPEHIIQWNDQDSDTLKFEVDVQNNGGYVSITKVWYNGDQAWDVATDNEIRLIKVVKD
jgi:hypothetical protein